MDKRYRWARVKMKGTTQAMLVGTYVLLCSLMTVHRTDALTSETCPSICHCDIQRLSINCSDKGLQRIRVLIPETTEILILDGNNIDMIPNFAFEHLWNLRRLSIQRNKIVKIGANAFRNLRNLEQLHLGGNLLTDVNNLELRDLRNLRVFDLHGNRLSRVPDRAMKYLQKLETLNVSRNAITSAKLKPGFEHAYELRSIDLSFNNISTLRKADLDVTLWWGKAKPMRLDLSRCNLVRITPGVFSQMYHLRWLSLSGNEDLLYEDLRSALADLQLSTISSLYLSSIGIRNIHKLVKGLQISTLETLDLSANAIEFIRKNTLLAFPHLKHLDLSRNNVSIVPGFVGLARLQQLSLARNAITEINDEMLNNLFALKSVDLSSNRLARLPASTFTAHTDIETLRLDANRLTELAFSKTLEKLTKLSVSRNKLSNISFVARTPNLRELDAADNVVRRLNAELFPATSKIVRANFSANAIIAIEDGTFADHSPQILDLSDNHLLAVGNFGWRGLKRLSLRHNWINSITGDTFKQSRDLQYLDLSYNWITSLNGALAYTPRLKTLHLGKMPIRKYLESAELTDFAQLTHLEELSLDNLGLHFVNRKILAATVRLRRLDLSHNAIKHLAKDVFNREGQLEYVNISHNHLDSVNIDMFNGLHRLNVLDLAHNPFHCTCELLNFLKWVHRSNISVVNVNDARMYKCLWPEAWTDVPLTELHFRMDNCMDATDRTIVYVALGFLLVLAILALVLMCYFIRCCMRPQRTRRDSYCELTDDNNDDDNAWV